MKPSSCKGNKGSATDIAIKVNECNGVNTKINCKESRSRHSVHALKRVIGAKEIESSQKACQHSQECSSTTEKLSIEKTMKFGKTTFNNKMQNVDQLQFKGEMVIEIQIARSSEKKEWQFSQQVNKKTDGGEANLNAI